MIRKAVTKDYKTIAKIIVDTWLTTYRSIIPDDYLNRLSYQDVEFRIRSTKNQDKLMIVYEIDNEVVGFLSYGFEKEQEYDYEVYALYVLKEFQNQKIGSQLLTFIFKLLKSGTLVVWTLKENNANYFYQKMGGSKVTDRIVSFSNKPLLENEYLFDLNKINEKKS